MATEIRAKTVVETKESQEQLKALKGAMLDTAKASKEMGRSNRGAGGEIMKLIRQFRLLQWDLRFIAQSFMDVGRAIVGVPIALSEAAAQEQQYATALSSLISTMQEVPFEQAIQKSQQLADEMDLLAIKTGAAGIEIDEGFQLLMERTGATAEGVEYARQTMGDLAVVAGVLGKDVKKLSEDFTKMSSGALNTRSELFQLLRTTGVFGNTLEGLGKTWKNLTDAQRAELLDSALGQISKKMADVPKGVHQQLTALQAAGRSIMESFGKPIISALVPELEGLLNDFATNRNQIVAQIAAVGRDIAGWLREAAAFGKSLYGDLGKAAKDLRMAFEVGKNVAAEIASQAEAFVTIASSVTPGLQMLIDEVKDLGKRRDIGQQITEKAETGADYSELLRQYQESIVGVAPKLEAPGMGQDEEGARELFAVRKKAWAARLAEDVEYQALMRIIEDAKQSAQPLTELRFDVMKTGVFEEFDANISRMNDIMSFATEAQMNEMAQWIAEDEALRAVFATNTTLTDDAFQDFIEMVRTFNATAAWELEQALEARKSEKAKPAFKTINDFRGSKFDIKQDFRDQDPDRVAILFRKDLMAAATRRTAAVTGTF